MYFVFVFVSSFVFVFVSSFLYPSLGNRIVWILLRETLELVDFFLEGYTGVERLAFLHLYVLTLLPLRLNHHTFCFWLAVNGCPHRAVGFIQRNSLRRRYICRVFLTPLSRADRFWHFHGDRLIHQGTILPNDGSAVLFFGQHLFAIFIYNPLGYTVVVGDIFAVWFRLDMVYGNVDGFAGFTGDGPGCWLTNIGDLFYPIHLAVSPGNSLKRLKGFTFHDARSTSLYFCQAQGMT